MQYVISVDVGTTALKSSLVGRDGTILDARSQEYPLIVDGPAIEQDPQLWWEAFCHTVGELTAAHPSLQPQAVVLSGQMQDLIRLEGSSCSSPAILYSDTRAQREFERFTDSLGIQELCEITQNHPDASSLPAKIMLLKSRSAFTAETSLLLGAHDYLCWRLTGRSVTDPTNAATTGLLNYRTACWDEQILSVLGITKGTLPLIEPAGSITGVITPEAAASCRLSAGLPVIHGAGDAASSTVGAGAGDAGVYSCYIGTSGWMAATTTHPVDPSCGMFNLKHPDGTATITIGAMRTAGGAISWLLDTFGITEDKYQQLQEIASAAAPGSSGLFFMPYLQGERSPFMDASAMGGYIGISRDTGRAQMFRAVLEGICYGLASIYQKITEGTGVEATHVVATGGGAENLLLMEILSSVLGIPVHIAAESALNGVLGSAVIAGKALGWQEDYRLLDSYMKIEKIIMPDRDAHQVYQKGLDVFTGLYPALREEFHHMTTVFQK
jgi:xylulokinase